MFFGGLPMYTIYLLTAIINPQEVFYGLIPSTATQAGFQTVLPTPGPGCEKPKNTPLE
jgi:hypothetical protein